jgi:uncharacterized protein (DUF4415 family)
MSKERITTVTLDEAMSMKGETDWARFDAMTDKDIAKQVAEDPSLPPLDIDWDKASLVIPPTAKDILTMRVDHDVLEWLRSTGPGYQTRVNQVLRAWRDATLREKGHAVKKAVQDLHPLKRHGVERVAKKAAPAAKGAQRKR